MTNLTDIMYILWLLLPAMTANMAPIFAAHFKWFESLNRPVDHYRSWRGHRLLGDHKTIRGFCVGIVTGALTALIQYNIAPKEIFITNATWNVFTSPVQALLLGALLGFGALAADSVKSFFKRQLNIRPGASWPIFDQTDFIIGSLLIATPFTKITIVHTIIAIIAIGLASFFTSSIGVLIGIKKTL